jgi:outer membrane receptor protein involved in Fe transport
VPFYSGNPFFPAGMQAAINAAPGPAQGNISSSVCGAQAAACFLRLVQDIGPLRQTETTEAKSFAFGLKGEVFKDWQVDAFYSHGDVDLKASEANQFENRPLRAALDVVTDPGTGRPVCRVTLTNPGLFPGCLPYNPFITNGNSAEVVSYITGVSQFRTRNKTDNASLSLSGQPFSTWAGPVGMSVGLEYRRDSLNLTSNSNPSVPIDYTGIRGINSASAPLRFFLTNRGIANGKRNVKEVFGELNVPLLRDAPFAQSLEVSGAVRYTDYSTSGTVTTWKAGVSYEPVDGLRFRATRSRDIRAPTLLDLYAGATTSLQNPTDPHCNCTSPNFLRSTSGGNPDLDPELGDTLSLGVILQPRFVPGFAISVDYYDLTIKDAIQTLGVPQILQDCEDSGGTANSCALISRPLPFSDRSAANVATAVRSVPANTARFQTRGIDIEASYNIRFGGSQNLNLRALANYIDKYTTQSSVPSPVQQLAGFSDGPETPALPTWRGTLSAQYSTENFSLSVQERIVGRIKTGPQFVYATKAMPTVYYTDVTVTAKVPGSEGSSELFLTVNNLFDKQPPLFPDRINSGVFYPTLQSVYDVMGRYFTAGVRLRF